MKKSKARTVKSLTEENERLFQAIQDLTAKLAQAKRLLDAIRELSSRY